MKKISKFIKVHTKEIVVVAILVVTAIVSFYTQDIYDEVWTWINNINVIVGFITAWIAYFTWRTAETLRRRYEVKKIQVENADAEKSIVLTISCGAGMNDKVPKAVMDFLAKNASEKEAYAKLLKGTFPYAASLSEYYKREDDNIQIDVENEHRVIHLKLAEMPGIQCQEEKLDAYMSSYATALENICMVLGVAGISTIYLFIGGPISIGYFAGERFKNNFMVYTYHNDRDNQEYYLISKQAFSGYVNKNKLIHIENNTDEK